MAENQRNRRGFAPVMNDSLARDLSRQRQTASRGSAAPQQTPDVRPGAETEIQYGLAYRRMAFVPTAAALFAVAMFLFVTVVQTRVEISHLNREIYTLERDITVASEEHDALEIRYESAFNFTELEDYAVLNLGMQRPRDEQIYSLSSSSSDHAVAVAEQNRSHGMLDRASDFFAELRSYFR